MVKPREFESEAYRHAREALARLSESGDIPDLGGPGTNKLEAWFLGPKAENAEEVEALVLEALRDHVFWRRNFHPEDPSHITAQSKRSRDYLEAQDRLTENFRLLLSALKRSVPFFSMRYQGHMIWDLTIPGLVGYFAAMLYNPNNVAFEASTVTTILEARVADDICKMLGYKIPSRRELDGGAIRPWGHITCDGTVANIEALWAARNVKLYPLEIKAALEKRFPEALEVEIVAADGRSRTLKQLDVWELVNIPCDEVLRLPARLEEKFGIGVEDLAAATDEFGVQNIGMYEFGQRFLSTSPVILVSGTKHYSFPKAAALLGLGAGNLIDVAVDVDARMDVGELERRLDRCLQNKTPVLAVVTVIGTTEESAVDPLTSVLDLRAAFRRKGLDFAVHADAAWGGYHVCTLRQDVDVGAIAAPAELGPPPRIPLSRYVQDQLLALGRADSITVDPHKSGYIPYPAGALCYRNSAIRNLVSFSAPVVFHGAAEPTVGIFGVEGSKPGAAAAAVFLSHSVIRPSKSGYGQIIGEALFSCKKLYCRLVTMVSDRFVCVPVPRLPGERTGRPDTRRDIERIRTDILDKTDAQIGEDQATMEFLAELGPDENILAYAFNFKWPDGSLNHSLRLANRFNSLIYDHLRIEPGKDVYDRTLIVSTTDFSLASYGKVFIDDYKERLGVGGSRGDTVTVLRSVVMDPWLTETEQGSFLDVIEAAFRAAITEVLPRVRR